MSLWLCPTHGFTGPTPCCGDAGRPEVNTADPYAALRFQSATGAGRSHLGPVEYAELRALLKERDELANDLAFARESICETGIASQHDPLWMSAAAYRIRKLFTEARPNTLENPDRSPE